jgi:hypothetical protein
VAVPATAAIANPGVNAATTLSAMTAAPVARPSPNRRPLVSTIVAGAISATDKPAAPSGPDYALVQADSGLDGGITQAPPGAPTYRTIYVQGHLWP